MRRRHAFRIAIGAAAITAVIAGSAVAKAGSEPRPPDGTVEALTVDGQEVANEVEDPQQTDQAVGANAAELGNEEVNPPMRAEDEPELALSVEDVADAGDGTADPTLDIGGVDGSLGGEQDG